MAGLALAWLSALCGGAWAGTYYVNDGTVEPGSVCTVPGDDENDGYAPDRPMRHIQTLLDRYPYIREGDTVWVDPGTYKENLSLDAGHSGLLLQGAGSDMTFLDGGGSRRCIYLDRFVEGVITGFTIKSGKASGDWPDNSGAGICCTNGSSPVIQHNKVTGSTAAGRGGGIYCMEGSSPVIRNNTISSNTAFSGGGISSESDCSPVIRDNSITSNSATGELAQGGGIECNGCSPEILNNTISSNTGAGNGGGIYCFRSSAKIRNNTISGNSATNGGGIRWHESSLRIEKNKITANSASSGGGMYGSDSSSTIRNNAVTLNAATEYGGGIRSDESSPIIRDNTFVSNSARAGGGISCRKGSATIERNTIRANTADLGGGIDSDLSAPQITNNEIARNRVDRDGGGIYCRAQKPTALDESLSAGARSSISGNVIRGNTASYGGGIRCFRSAVKMRNNTLTGNAAERDGGAVSCYKGASPTMANCILWENSAVRGNEVALERSARLKVSYSDVEGGRPQAYVGGTCKLDWGNGNIDADPLFVDPTVPAFQLEAGSPCVDAADGDRAPAKDKEGDPRYDDPDTPNTGSGKPRYADMGAYEFQGPVIRQGVVTVGHRWKRVRFSQPFSRAPVVVAGPATSNDKAPGVVRIRNVRKESFQIRFQEWDYLDGRHEPEQIAWLAARHGVSSLGKNKKLMAQTFKTSATDPHKAARVKFPQPFGKAPVVLCQVQTANDGRAVTDRICKADKKRLKVVIQGQEATGKHREETVGYIALNRKRIQKIGDVPCAVGVVRAVSHKSTQITTRLGACRAYVEEEKSKDKEIKHRPEKVGYVAFGGTPLLVADVQSCKESDPATVRYERTLSAVPSLCRLDIRARDARGAVLPRAAAAVPALAAYEEGARVALQAQNSLSDGGRLLTFDH